MIGALAIGSSLLAVLADDEPEDFDDLFRRSVAFENPALFFNSFSNDQLVDALRLVAREWVVQSKDLADLEARLTFFANALYDASFRLPTRDYLPVLGVVRTPEIRVEINHNGRRWSNGGWRDVNVFSLKKYDENSSLPMLPTFGGKPFISLNASDLVSVSPQDDLSPLTSALQQAWDFIGASKDTFDFFNYDFAVCEKTIDHMVSWDDHEVMLSMIGDDGEAIIRRISRDTVAKTIKGLERPAWLKNRKKP
jgi:hypothetical protein